MSSAGCNSSQSESVSDVPSSSNQWGSITRRSLAYVVDSFIVGLIGYSAGSALFPVFSRLGLWARLIGFAVAMTYFACFDGKIGNGQTLGKQLFRLRVVDAQGNTFSTAAALVRSAIFVTPINLFGMRLPESRTPWMISVGIELFTLWMGGATILLMLLNRNGRQGLHDLAVGSYVMKAESRGLLTSRSRELHWVVPCVLLSVVSVGLVILNAVAIESPQFQQMHRDVSLIEPMPGVQRADVKDYLHHEASGGQARKKLVVTVIVGFTHQDLEPLASNAIRMILKNDPNAESYDEISVRLFWGYDLGIASSWRHKEITKTPREWQQTTET